MEIELTQNGGHTGSVCPLCSSRTIGKMIKKHYKDEENNSCFSYDVVCDFCGLLYFVQSIMYSMNHIVVNYFVDEADYPLLIGEVVGYDTTDEKIRAVLWYKQGY